MLVRAQESETLRQRQMMGNLPSYKQALANASNKTSQLKNLSSYMGMVLNPHQSTDATDLCRYPDETIIPTSLVSLQDSLTWTQSTGPTAGSVAGSFVTALRWKCSGDDATYTINGSPILTPTNLISNINTFANTWQNYVQQSQWLGLSAIDRTLATGIRVRFMSLGLNTFMPAGTLYFIQYQNNELTGLLSQLSAAGGEATARALVAARRGFAVTCNEISKTSGVTIPYLPQGPMSFVFSDSGKETAAVAGEGSFSGLSIPPSSILSANGGVLVVGFGLNDGCSMRLDYGHIIEYVPTVLGAGLVQTGVQQPSSTFRDAISTAAGLVQKELAGSTSLDRLGFSGGLSHLGEFAAKAALGLGSAAFRSVVPGGGMMLDVGRRVIGASNAPPWLQSAASMLG